MTDAAYPEGPPAQPKVVIVGGGISGLCIAHWLKRNAIPVLVLERDDAPGGTMKTVTDGGWLIETGPNTALETTPLIQQILQETGILDQRVYASEHASKRYIVRGGELYPLPMSPLAFLSSRLWTLQGKLRLLGEPFARRAPEEESIAAFVRRRLGSEFLDYAIDPFVAGVYAGDPAQLSVRAAFPKLYALEERYGGLIVGTIRSRKERRRRQEVAKDRARLFSFAGGMQRLPLAIAHELGDSLRLRAPVDHVIPMRAGQFPVYTVRYRDAGEKRTVEAPVVVLSVPAYAAASMVRPIDPEFSAVLDAIEYPPVAEVFLGVRSGQVGRELDGFGFLVPGIEHRRILGSLWSSSLFRGRAPAGHAALSTFVGGSRQPSLVSRDDTELLGLVRDELQSLIHLEGHPVYSRIIRWDRAIPQYTLGYYRVLQGIERFEQNFQGAFICGNYRGGIAVGDCVMSAEKTFRNVQHHLRRIR